MTNSKVNGILSSMPEKLTPCPSCQVPISSQSEWCPSCGRKTPFYDFVIVQEGPEEEEIIEASPVATQKKARSFEDKFWAFMVWTILFIIMAIILIIWLFAPVAGRAVSISFPRLFSPGVEW